jgi:hypothetical protein
VGLRILGGTTSSVARSAFGQRTLVSSGVPAIIVVSISCATMNEGEAVILKVRTLSMDVCYLCPFVFVTT